MSPLTLPLSVDGDNEGFAKRQNLTSLNSALTSRCYAGGRRSKKGSIREVKKTTSNYFVDCVILVAFVMSAISGLVFLAPLTWFDANAATGPSFAGISLGFWNALHTHASLAMIGGVTLHLILHWGWILTMTKRTFGRARNGYDAQLTRDVGNCIEGITSQLTY